MAITIVDAYPGVIVYEVGTEEHAATARQVRLALQQLRSEDWPYDTVVIGPDAFDESDLMLMQRCMADAALGVAP